MKSYLQSAFKILQIGTEDAVSGESGEGGKVPWSERQDNRPTPRLMCAVASDGLCVAEHACRSACLCGAGGQTEPRCLIKTGQDPGCCLLDTAASPPPPGHLPYCTTGSCSGRSSPPAYPPGESLRCPDNPASPVPTQSCTHARVKSELRIESNSAER